MKRINRWLKKIIGRPTRAGCLHVKSDSVFELIAADTKIELLATGFLFTEGPIWISEKKCLLFSDIPANKIFQLAHTGQVTTFRHASGNSNGLTRDKQGLLIACEHANRRVTRTEHDGRIINLVNKYQAKRLNSPNDVVVKSDGTIYFTDPTYGIKPDQQEQPVQGVYRLSSDQTTLSLVLHDFKAPNGLAFSPDERRLYVGDSELCYVKVYEVQSDGTLQNERIFCNMNTEKPGVPDGMKVDVKGNIYCTGPGGVWILDSNGNHYGTIIIPEQATNCAWGDDDLKGLYITAQTSIYKIRVNIPGIKV